MNLHEEIAQEISLNGVMPFSRFMELALYHPSLGFYASGGAGRRKDFITSPETGPLFGKLVASALDKWWKELGNPDPFYFIEAGAGPGTLARSILKVQPDCQRALRYITVEESALQRSQHPEGVESFGQLPSKSVTGVVFANELLDNLPFDIYESQKTGEWSQVCVGSSDGLFHEVLIKADEDLNDLFGIAQSPGTRIPYQTMARRWLNDALGLIESGRVVVVDYALPSFPAPTNHKWLRTYRGHGLGE
ncbi:MAG: SAM-dependent methyltransferase, partial [Actinomycetota bacterium]|nr:SAM-dependent methyltransferase [Actinomycetota bacterium]